MKHMLALALIAIWVLTTFAQGANKAVEAPAGDRFFGWGIALGANYLAVLSAGDALSDPPQLPKLRVYGLDDLKLQLEADLPGTGKLVASGNVLAIGHPYAAQTTDSGINVDGAGQVTLYRRIGTVWKRLAPVSELTPRPFGNFGADLALKPGSLAVTAPGTKPSEAMIYVFQMAATGASLEASISNHSGGSGVAGVAWLDDHLVFGDTFHCCGGTVKLYDHLSKVETASVTSPSPGLMAAFGTWIRVTDKTLLVGGAGISQGDGNAFPGQLHVYEAEGGQIMHRGRLAPEGLPDAPLGGQDAGINSEAVFVPDRGHVIRYRKGTNGLWKHDGVVPGLEEEAIVLNVAATSDWLAIVTFKDQDRRVLLVPLK